MRAGDKVAAIARANARTFEGVVSEVIPKREDLGYDIVIVKGAGTGFLGTIPFRDDELKVIGHA